MPVTKLLGTSTSDTMISDERSGYLDTSITQPVGTQPLLLFSRTAEDATQWIQLLHSFDQKDLPGLTILAPVKVQMQKCEKCDREFCSTINYRRHIRVHRRSMNLYKETENYRDILGAFWDKLDYNKAKEILSFKDVSLEEVPGYSIINNIAANMRNLNFLSFPQEYAMSGSALVDIIQDRSSTVSISSEELFRVLDDASERTFLCAGTAESLKKYVFDGDAGKIGLEMNNSIACTSFLVEQNLVNAWFADKDAEALRCQKLLVEEEEAAQKRQAELLERKKQRKIRQKEQRARDQSDVMKVDIYTASDVSECDTSAEDSSCHISPVINSIIPDENIITPFDPLQSSSYEEVIDHLASTVNDQQMINNSSHHFISQFQLPKFQRNDHPNSQNVSYSKWKQPHRQKEQQRVNNNNSGKVWTKKCKPENIVKSSVHSDVNNNQTDMNSCQLMIGSISVTMKNRTGQNQVNSSAADGSKSHIVEQDVTSARGVDQTLTTKSNHQSRELTVNDVAKDDISKQMEGGGKLIPFSIDAAKDFLSKRWKEAISRDHVELVLTTAPESQMGG